MRRTTLRVHRLKTLVAITSTGALVSMGAIGLSGSVAYAAAAQHPPTVTDLGVIYPSPNVTGQLPPMGAPSVTVVGTCPDFLFGTDPTDPLGGQYAIGFAPQSGSAVEYRIPPGAPPGVSNGANFEGIADLVYADPGLAPSSENPNGVPPAGTNLTDSGYTGHTHLWFGSNTNPNFNPPNGNLQQYFGETISFQGTAPNGATITITANPGFNSSASGHMNGWGKLKVTCTGTPYTPPPTS